MTPDALIAALEAHVGDAAQGLPEEVFLLLTRLTPMINVDLLIRDEAGRVLLTWREDPYWPAGWHVPGGIIRSREPIAVRIAATAANELGVRVEFEPAPLAVNELIHPERATRGHFISLLYACRLASELPAASAFAGGAPKHGAYAWFASCPENLLEVHAIYRDFFR